ncbi:MAG: hypothetical protein LBJ67_00090 [Planctomycetaceae bacterium]|jgi:hypothetical protein|nr:hypothetical protein [Planctomycetaceae bacterium]
MTKHRFFFTVGSFAATMAAYAFYSQMLVPFILPAKDAVSNVTTQPPRNLENKELLGKLFEPDSWVFDGTDRLTVQDGGLEILYNKLENLNENQYQVSPCAVLMFPNNHRELTPEEKYRQAVVLEASNYAVLELTGDILSGNIQFKSGQFGGTVTIRSDMKKPDTSDDLKVTTSDVSFDFNQIQTRNRVDFQFGPNRGNGSRLIIELANADETKKGNPPNTVKRIELQQLGELRLYVSDKKSADALALPSSPPTQQKSAEQLSEVIVTCKGVVDSSADPNNPSQWLLTFRDQVDVIRPTMGGAADKLTCQQLEIAFGEKANNIANLTANRSSNERPESNKSPLSRFNSFEPLQVKATGTPVIAASPSTKSFQAVGNELTLDLVRDELSLLGGNSISLLYDQFKMSGKALYYAYDRNGGIGKLDMPDAGTLEGRAGAADAKTFRLTWSDQLKVLPDKNDPALTLVQIQGSPKIQVQGIGDATADEVFLWCDTNKKNADATSANGNLLSANSNLSGRSNAEWDLKTILLHKRVLLKTEDGECTTNELKITFQEPPAQSNASGGNGVAAAGNGTAAAGNGAAAAGNRSQATPASQASQASGRGGALRLPVSLLSGNGVSASGTQGNQTSPTSRQTPKSSYTVYADQIEILASMVGQETLVDQIIMTKSVKLDERALAGAASDPIHLSGAKVHIRKPDSPETSVTIFGDSKITGGHAMFIGRGVTLMGANINVDRAKNLFWVDGQGRLEISAQAVAGASATGNTASATRNAGNTGNNLNSSFAKLFGSNPQTAAANANKAIIIDWRGSMEFDGQRLFFIKDVDVNYSLMAINKSERIEVYLAKPFRFFEKDDAGEVEAERIVVRGNIDIDRDAYDAAGQTSRAHIKLTAIEVFPKTGSFKGLGPGHISSIFNMKAKDSQLLNGAGNPSMQSAASSQEPPKSQLLLPKSGVMSDGLKFLQCDFFGSAEGNYNTGQIVFRDKTVTVICPVQTFRDVVNVNNTRNIIANGMRLECNQLTLNQNKIALSNAASIEMKAEGNTRIEMTHENRYYIANADKIMFDQAKNLLTFMGNVYSDAVLSSAANMNAPTQRYASAKRIELNLVTREGRVDGISGNFFIP